MEISKYDYTGLPLRIIAGAGKLVMENVYMNALFSI
jgi:hypothetical protein